MVVVTAGLPLIWTMNEGMNNDSSGLTEGNKSQATEVVLPTDLDTKERVVQEIDKCINNFDVGSDIDIREQVSPSKENIYIPPREKKIPEADVSMDINIEKMTMTEVNDKIDYQYKHVDPDVFVNIEADEKLINEKEPNEIFSTNQKPPVGKPKKELVFDDWIVSSKVEISEKRIIVKGDTIVTSTGNLILKDVELICSDVNIAAGGKFIIDPSEIIQSGNLYISGSYTLDATTLKMNCTSDGQYIIQVNSSGTMKIINGSVVTAVNPNYEYKFVVKTSANFLMQDSELHECGYQWPWGGLEIWTNNVKIENNLISYNYYGLFLRGDKHYIAHNTFKDNYRGIYVYLGADNNTILNNYWLNNTESGIVLGYQCNDNLIDNNICEDNHDDGIHLYSDCNNNIIVNNTLLNNDNNGIYLYNSKGNIIYHNNILNNVNQVYDNSPAKNNWHHTSLLEGNYWSDYTGVDDGSGSGKHSIAGDFIGDTKLPHPAANFDNYPFIIQDGWKIIYVDDDYTGSEVGFGTYRFKVIQNAVNNATSGCIIYIFNGTYNENVKIDKQLFFYGDLVGASLGGDLTIKNGGNLTLKGFKLMMNSTFMGEFGIYVKNGGALYLMAFNNVIPSIIDNGKNAPGGNASAYYTFQVKAGSIFEMYNSEVRNAGFAENLPDFSWAGIWIHTDHAIIHNSVIRNNHFHGLILFNSSGHRIINCNIYSNDRNGIWGMNSHNNIIKNNYIYSNGWDGIHLSNATGTVIENNEIKFNGDDGIDIISSTEIIGNIVNNNGDNGIVVSNSPGAIITDNTVNYNGDDGIYIQNSPNSVITDNIAKFNDEPVDVGTGLVVMYSDDSEIKRNNFEKNWRGMYVQNSSDCIISNNNVIYNHWHGIQLYFSYQSKITNNTASGNSGTGIIVPIVSLITNNSADNNGDDGIYISSSPDIKIHNNTVISNGDDGLIVSASDRCIIENIAATHNGNWGIILTSSEDCIIRLNTANNSGHGIYVGSSMRCIIDDNYANDCGDDGIYVSTSSKSIISNNTANLNDVAVDRGTGIVLLYSSGVQIKYNKVNDNYQGMYIEQSSDCEIFINDVISNSGHGIEVVNSNNPIIQDHLYIKQNGGWGIYVHGSPTGADITKNSINNNYGGICVVSSPGSNIDNNTANDNSGTGIYLSSCSGSEITFNQANSNWRGMYILSSSNCNIISNEVNSNIWYGIHLYYSAHNLLSKNIVKFNTGEWDSLGIYLSRSVDNTIRHNQVNSNWHGVKLWYSYDCTIKNNEVNSNNNFGISLEYSGRATKDPTITQNIVNSNGDSGISLENSDYVIIDINIVTFNHMGISLYSSDFVKITDNIADSNNYGIYLTGSTYNIIFKNSVERKAGKGIYGIFLTSYSNKNSISRNSAKFNYFGITLKWGCSLNIISENDATYCIDYAAFLYRVNWNTLQFNEFNNSNSIGIYLEQSDNNEILSNNATTATNYGISLFESDSNEIILNNVTTGGDIGLELSSSNENELLNNIAEFCDVGISLKWSNKNDITYNEANENSIGIYMLRSDENEISSNAVDDNDNVAIDLSLSDKNTITNNSVINNANYGIHLYSSDNNELTNNLANNNGIGIYLDWSSENLIKSNTATGNNLIGVAIFWSSNDNAITDNNANLNVNESIRISYSENNLVENNQASGSIVGIHIDWSPNNNIIRNNTANNNKVGISLEWFSNNNQILNNTATNGIIGISVRWSNWNYIDNNDFSHNTVSTILEWYSHNNTVSNNIATNSEFGIYLDWYCRDNLISFNNASDNNQNGITLEKSVGDIVDNNTVMNNMHGIYCTQADPTISSNQILNPPTTIKTHIGIYIEDYSDPTVIYNTIENTAIAIYVGPTCSPIITGNIISDDSTFGIYMISASATIIGNHISLNTYGIFLEKSYAVIKLNNITDNYYGVYCDESSPIIDNNTISNHYYGIYCINSAYPIVTNNIFSNNNYDLYYHSKQVGGDTISQLQALKTGNTTIDSKLDEAINHIKKSLDNALWQNETHLDPKRGNEYFDEVKKAINELQNIINDNKVAESIKDGCRDVIDKLVNAARVLAENALKEAKVYEGTKNKVDLEIKKAENELTKATNELTKGNPDLAIDHYKKTWIHAQAVIDEATK